MSAVPPPDPVVFFADCCFGKKAVLALREQGFRVEWHLDRFAMDAPDVEWLPVVSRKGWVILSADKAMKPGTVEFNAVIASGARMFVLARGDYTGQAVINILATHLDRIVAHIADNPGPYIVSLSTNGFRVVHPRPPKPPRLAPDTRTVSETARRRRIVEID